MFLCNALVECCQQQQQQQEAPFKQLFVTRGPAIARCQFVTDILMWISEKVTEIE